MPHLHKQAKTINYGKSQTTQEKRKKDLSRPLC